LLGKAPISQAYKVQRPEFELARELIARLALAVLSQSKVDLHTGGNHKSPYRRLIELHGH
jgi:hypothetical protein